MSHVVNTVALANAAQPKGQLPAGPAYLYGAGLLVCIVLFIVIVVRDSRRRRGPTSADLRKLWEDEQFTRTLIENTRRKP